jgi:hypothetical protein
LRSAAIASAWLDDAIGHANDQIVVDVVDAAAIAADDAHNTLAKRKSMAARTGKGMATLEIVEIGSRYYAMRLKYGRFD